MSQGIEQKTDLCAQSEGLLQGRLKHTRTAALALALVPLAAVAASTMEANEVCPSGGICGTVFYDQNGNGIQDAGEGGISGATVTITYVVDIDGTPTPFTSSVATDGNGLYDFGTSVPHGEWTISVATPPGTTPSPTDQGSDDSADSDGKPEGPNSVATVNWSDDEVQESSTDFGFDDSAAANPGTGTPGYWKNHPEAWPVATITVGGTTYTKAQAIAKLDTPGKDKSLTMFSSLVSAMLNVTIGNDASCVAPTIAKANDWMAKYGPAGSNVAASSYAWKVGEPFHRLMDDYNNGGLCAPHRN